MRNSINVRIKTKLILVYIWEKKIKITIPMKFFAM